jgi:hypothetical protein
MSEMWEELKGFVRKGEYYLQDTEEHLAILLARKLDAERRKEIVAAIDVAVEQSTAGDVGSAPAAESVDTTAAKPAKGK